MGIELRESRELVVNMFFHWNITWLWQAPNMGQVGVEFQRLLEVQVFWHKDYRAIHKLEAGSKTDTLVLK